MTAPNSKFEEPVTPSDKAKKWPLSDEEMEGGIDKRNLTYRMGWPQLPPMPITETRTGARLLVHDHEQIILGVRELCNHYNLHTSDIYFAFRVPKDRQEVGEKYLTLVVSSNPFQGHLLTQLIISISRLLHRNEDNRGIAIEIIDHRVVHGQYSHVVRNKAVIDNWSEIYDEAIKIMRVHKQPYSNMELLRRGVPEDASQCPSTLVISTPTASNDVWWQLIIPEVRKAIRTICDDLDVEVLCGSTIRLSSPGEAQLTQNYEKIVPMGASIGQSTLENQSETAGGMIRLSNGIQYALTCHHVIEDDHIKTLIYNSQGERIPLRPNHPSLPLGRLTITCPSNQDDSAYKKELDTTEAFWKPRESHDAKDELARIMAAREKVKSIGHRRFGTAWASSGHRSVRGGMLSTNPKTGQFKDSGKRVLNVLMDWSLSVFSSDRRMANKLPQMDQNIAPSSQANQIATLRSKQPCTHWTSLSGRHTNVLSDEVSAGKYGRSSQMTYGTVSPTPVIISPTSDGGQYKKISSIYGLTDEDCGHALSFVGHGKEQVVETGDSGSIILHAPSGHWLGLLFGMTSTGSGLFTPIDHLIRDIEAVTGSKVTEPTFDAYDS